MEEYETTFIHCGNSLIALDLLLGNVLKYKHHTVLDPNSSVTHTLSVVRLVLADGNYKFIMTDVGGYGYQVM